MTCTFKKYVPTFQVCCQTFNNFIILSIFADLTQRPVTSDAFRPRSNASSRPKTNGSGSRPKTPRRSPNNNGNNSNPEPCRLRYTKTPVMGNTMNSMKPKSTFDEVLNDDSHPVWNPDATTIGP